MKKSQILVLVSCFVLAITTVLVIYAFSEKIVHEPSSFLRKYIPHFAYSTKRIDIKYNSYYIAGTTGDKIYLGNTSNPFHLLVINYDLSDTSHIRLRIENRHNLALTKYLRVKIDSPYFYMSDGLLPGIFRGTIGEWKAKRFMHDSAYFSQLVPIGGRTVGIRARSSKTNENVLGTITAQPPHIRLDSSLLQKQIDGVFCTDGTLSFAKKINRLVYTYYYRNEFVVYDTNLNIDYRGNTIDTFHIAQIKLARINSEMTTTLATRPNFVNISSCTSGNYLFVHSYILAKNDGNISFDRITPIDVYDLKSKSYKLSFRVGDKLREFSIHNNKALIGLNKNYLLIYNLKSEFL